MFDCAFLCLSYYKSVLNRHVFFNGTKFFSAKVITFFVNKVYFLLFLINRLKYLLDYKFRANLFILSRYVHKCVIEAFYCLFFA